MSPIAVHDVPLGHGVQSSYAVNIVAAPYRPAGQRKLDVESSLTSVPMGQ